MLVNEIVQLNPEKCGNPMLAACFMVVTEVRDWGVIGYVQCPGKDGEIGGQAYYRARFDEIERTGGIAPYILGALEPPEKEKGAGYGK